MKYMIRERYTCQRGKVPEYLQSQRLDANLSIEMMGDIDDPTNEIKAADVMLNPRIRFELLKLLFMNQGIHWMESSEI